jgi:hypothetical protein
MRLRRMSVSAAARSGAFAFLSGSDVQSAYQGPWDCYNMGQYAAAHGMNGDLIVALQTDEGAQQTKTG